MRPCGMGQFDGTFKGHIEDFSELFHELFTKKPYSNDASIDNDDVELAKRIDRSYHNNVGIYGDIYGHGLLLCHRRR